MLAIRWKLLVRVPFQLHQPLTKIQRKHAKISYFSDELVHQLFRFDDRRQLRDLLAAFRFPPRFVCDSRHTFSGEEILLAGLFRLHAPNVLGDTGWRTLFGFDQPTASRACNLFFLFMVDNWAYLLQDHLDFWKSYLPQMAELIRCKLEKEGCYFAPGTFRVCSFIDNTMNATCRPAGGPTADGRDAPRYDPLIQQAWYNGWKKLHGLKWQTLDLPNGMNMHVWGPVSLRHNDIWTLEVIYLFLFSELTLFFLSFLLPSLLFL